MLEAVRYGLLAALAIALVLAALTDWRRRHIDNWLTAAVALGGLAFWWASGLQPWPGIVLQAGLFALTFAVCAGLFALRAMGGGDVKLLAALALWIEPAPFARLLVLMALIGGALTLGMVAWHIQRRRPGLPEIPYGVAIAAAGLWVLASDWLWPGAAESGENQILTI